MTDDDELLEERTVTVGRADDRLETDERDARTAFVYVPDLSAHTGWSAYPVPRDRTREAPRRRFGFGT